MPCTFPSGVPALMALAALFAASAPEPAAAQGSVGSPQSDWTITLGGGLLAAPLYLGDDSYGVSALPSVTVQYRDLAFASLNQGIGANVIRKGGWRAGPVARYDFGRDEDGEGLFLIAGEETDDLRGLGDLDGSVELGGFVEYGFDGFAAKGEIRQGVGGHGGLLGDVALTYSDRADSFGLPLFVTVGTEARFADSEFMNAYFGVDAGQAARSGLMPFDAEGGLVSVGVNARVIAPLSREVAVTAVAGYDRLMDDAADSSLVETRGTPDQATGGLFLTYRFGL